MIKLPNIQRATLLNNRSFYYFPPQQQSTAYKANSTPLNQLPLTEPSGAPYGEPRVDPALGPLLADTFPFLRRRHTGPLLLATREQVEAPAM